MKTVNILLSPLFSLIGRNFRYNRFYTLINICGLAFGLCCAIFILLFLKDELTYDRHHLKHERIYRLESDFTINGRNQKTALTSYTFGPAFQQLYPEIESFVRFKKVDPLSVRGGMQDYFEKNLFYVDSTVFDIFTYHFIYGSPEEALNKANTIVITRSMSERYFGDEDPCGKKIRFGDGSQCIVTAVIENVPGNSHLQFDGLISMGTHARLIGQEMFTALETRHAWAFRLHTFILLKENTSIESIHKKFSTFYDEYMAELSEYFGGSYRMLSSNITDIHLYSGLEWDLPTGDTRTIYLFAIIGVFILLIASINYMNLATARSSSKAKEVGIRKLSGASKEHLIVLYIAESVTLSLIALAIALTMADLLMPWFNELSGKSLVLLYGFTDPVLYILIGISLLLGFISGSYPALYLASFKPANVLYNRIFMARRAGWPRRLLIIFQFAISLCLVIGTIVVYEQLVHLKTKELGFDKENLLVISSADTNVQRSYSSLRAELLKISGVNGVSSAMFITGIDGNMDIMKVEDSGQVSQQLIGLNFITDHFVNLMGMDIIKGRDFNIVNQTDAGKHVLINETAANKLGWADDPLGKELSPSDNEGDPYKVIGVIKDFHFAPLHQAIGPMVYFLRKTGQKEIFVKISSTAQPVTIKKIEKAWKRIHPELPFTYNFLSQEMKTVYSGEQKLLQLMGMFALISIFIALLGLFSLSSYLTEQYTRVIGIKKVFGASPLSIVIQLSRQYLSLIMIACAISVPLCWYLMSLWLENFAYRVDIRISWFIISIVGLLLVAECTVIIQSMHAANRNPVDTLRYE